MADNPKEDDVKCVCRVFYAFCVLFFVSIDVILDRIQDENQEHEIIEVVKDISEIYRTKYFSKKSKKYMSGLIVLAQFSNIICCISCF